MTLNKYKVILEIHQILMADSSMARQGIRLTHNHDVSLCFVAITTPDNKTSSSHPDQTAPQEQSDLGVKLLVFHCHI